MDPFEAASKQSEHFSSDDENTQQTDHSTMVVPSASGEGKEDQEEEAENADAVFQSLSSTSANNGESDKLAKMKAIISQLTDDQMDRYEYFRRSWFKKKDMRRLLLGITGMGKISEPMIIAVSATAKLFVGDNVETARTVMVERKDSGAIRPCHVREAYRRLKLEGKVPRRSVPRLFL